MPLTKEGKKEWAGIAGSPKFQAAMKKRASSDGPDEIQPLRRSKITGKLEPTKPDDSQIQRLTRNEFTGRLEPNKGK